MSRERQRACQNHPHPEKGRLAEHLLVVRSSTWPAALPRRRGFPSACGKTNVAVLRPTPPGWRVGTTDDDTARLQPGPGRLFAINPEAEFFGVAPGTGPATNSAAVDAVSRGTTSTNIALDSDGDGRWQGLTPEPPEALTDRRGEPRTPDFPEPVRHPNARFTVPIDRCPTIDDGWDSPDGVAGRHGFPPIRGDGRVDGVFIGGAVATSRPLRRGRSRRCAALRCDWFAMLPFCGYDIAAYLQHRLDIGGRARAARFSHVPRQPVPQGRRRPLPVAGPRGRCPRARLDHRRLAGDVAATPSPIGFLRERRDLDLAGLNVRDEGLEALPAVGPASWRETCDAIGELFDRFEGRAGTAPHGELFEVRCRNHVNAPTARSFRDRAIALLREAERGRRSGTSCRAERATARRCGPRA